jgi:hypothetical protein
VKLKKHRKMNENGFKNRINGDDDQLTWMKREFFGRIKILRFSRRLSDDMSPRIGGTKYSWIRNAKRA